MPYLNNCQFMGHLGADPELRHTANGNAVCNARIAVKTGRGEYEHTEWVSLVAWNRGNYKMAEYMAECVKGEPIFVEGEMRTRKWQDKEGKDRYTTEINVDQFQRLRKRDDQGKRDSHDDGGGSGDNGGVAEPDDDIPF